jgi:hypothetical protein
VQAQQLERPERFPPAAGLDNGATEVEEGEPLSGLRKTIAGVLGSAKRTLKNSWIARLDRETEPGGKLFWVKSVVVLVLLDVSFTQRSRLGVPHISALNVDHPYALTSADHTVYQALAMMWQLDMGLLMFFFQNELGFILTNWIADLTYIVIRWNLAGPASMKAQGGLDFFTLALTFFFVVKEVNKFVKFVSTVEARSAREPHPLQYAAAAAVAVGGTCLCGYVAYRASGQSRDDLDGYCLQANKIRCNANAGITGIDFSEDILLEIYIDSYEYFCPVFNTGSLQGFQCMGYRYDFFADDPCTACAHARITASPLQNCSVINPDDRSQKIWRKDIVEGLLLRVEVLDIQMHAGCDMTPYMAKTISSFTSLRALSISGYSSAELSWDFRTLENLINVNIRHSTLERIDVDLLEHWHGLQEFSCRPCPLFESVGVFSTAKLDSLTSLEFYGAAICPDAAAFSDQLDSYDCILNSTMSSCGGVPQWFYSHWIDNVQKSTRGGCIGNTANLWVKDITTKETPFWPLSQFRIAFSHWGGALAKTYSEYTDDAFFCILSDVRKVLPFDQHKTRPYTQLPGVYPQADKKHNYTILAPHNTVQDGMTRYEFLAMVTGYTNGYTCVEGVNGGRKWYNADYLIKTLRENVNPEETGIDLPSECRDVWSDSVPINAREWPDFCDLMFHATGLNFNDGKNACDAIWPAVYDNDIDGIEHLMNEAELAQAAKEFGLGSYVRPGIFQCLRALGRPGCMDNVGNAEVGFQTRSITIPQSSIWGQTTVDGPLDVLTIMYFFDDLAIESWDEGAFCDPCSVNQEQYYLWRLVKIDDHPVSNFDELLEVYLQYEADYCCVSFTLQGPDHIPITSSITESTLILGAVDESNQGAEWGHIEDFLGWNVVKINDVSVTNHDEYRRAWESTARDHDVILTVSEVRKRHNHLLGRLVPMASCLAEVHFCTPENCIGIL